MDMLHTHMWVHYTRTHTRVCTHGYVTHAGAHPCPRAAPAPFPAPFAPRAAIGCRGSGAGRHWLPGERRGPPLAAGGAPRAAIGCRGSAAGRHWLPGERRGGARGCHWLARADARRADVGARRAAETGRQCGRHEQSAPARAEEVHGQEAVVEAERRPARAGHPAGLRPLHEPRHRRVRGDGGGRAAEQHRHGGDPREQHHHAGSFGTSVNPWNTPNPNHRLPSLIQDATHECTIILVLLLNHFCNG